MSVRFPRNCLIALCAVWIATGMRPPAGHLDWFLENLPAMVLGSTLGLSASRLRLSNWLYGWLFVHALILAYGGYYTYAEAPLGDVLQWLFHASRNPYDRVGHVAQGFIPSILFRELLLRTTPLRRGFAVSLLTVCCALALSASYELLEGFTAHFVDQAAGDAFLGTQGDVWDTQWDMFCALCGSLAAQLPLLLRLHDRSMSRVDSVVTSALPR